MNEALGNVGSDRLIDNLLLQFDEELRDGRMRSWECYLDQCHDVRQKAALLSLMILTESEGTEWNPLRIRERFVHYPESKERDGWIRSLLQQVYLDRIRSNERPSLGEFECFGVPAEELRLRSDDDVFFLGYAVGGRYGLEQRIGKGSFGIVYRATDLANGSVVAVKVTHGKDMESRIQARELLEQEASALKDLSHPNIPRFIVLVGEADEVLCIVMEFVSGRRLFDVLTKGSVPPHRVASISAAIADALDHAHRRGYVHRDLSPGNVLLDEADRPHLLDFGLALSSKTRFEKKPLVGGTRVLMPVESLSGKIDSLDGRCDIWSLGALMYSMLVGRANPLNLQPEAATFSSLVLSSDALQFPPEVPEELVTICRKCLHRIDHYRFDTAGEVAGALHDFFEGRRTNVAGSLNLHLGAWRMGAGIGIACALELEARAWLRLAESSQCTNEEMVRSAWYSALRRVLDAIESYHLAVDLGESIGVALEPMVWQYTSCHEVILEGSEALDNAGFWIPKKLEEVDYYVGHASEALHANLKAKDERAAALFRLVVLAAVCATDDETSDMLTELARTSGLKKNLWSQLVEATRAKSGFEILQREFNRLNKTVERELSYGTAFESA